MTLKSSRVREVAGRRTVVEEKSVTVDIGNKTANLTAGLILQRDQDGHAHKGRSHVGGNNLDLASHEGVEK